MRSARREDARSIRALIHQVGINPTGLDWRRFIVIVDDNARLLACGQVKPHGDGTRELASIAVQPDVRGHGLARAVIEQLMKSHGPPLYLTCRDELQPFYGQFGFQTVPPAEMPPYFRRIHRLVSVFTRLFRLNRRLLVMFWKG